MKIHLNQTEIQTALVEFIGNQGFDISGRRVDVSLTAGRGANGHYADIEIHEQEVQEDQTADDPLAKEPAEEQQAIQFSFQEAD